MAGFARIPIIEQRIGTPSAPSPVRGGAPASENPLGVAAKGLADISELGKVLAIQAGHQQILDSEDKEQLFKAQVKGFQQEASQMQGSLQAPYVAQKAKEAAQAILDDPANAHIATRLKQRFAALQPIIAVEAKEQGALQTAKDQHDQWKVIEKSLATTAAADYQVTKQGAFTDGLIARATTQKAYGMIDAMWPNNPQAASTLKQEFDARTLQERATFIADNRPHDLDTFIKAHAESLTPDQQHELIGRADQSLSAPIRTLDRNVALAHVAAVNKLDATIQQQGRGAAEAQATRLYHSHVITIADFEQRFAHPPVEAETPGVYDQVLAGVKSSPLEWSDGIISQITAGKVPDERVVDLKKQWRAASRERETAIGVAKADAGVSIRRAMSSGNLIADQLFDQIVSSEVRGGLRRYADQLFTGLTAKATTVDEISKAADIVTEKVRQERKSIIDSNDVLKNGIQRAMATAAKIKGAAIRKDHVNAAAAAAKATGWTSGESGE